MKKPPPAVSNTEPQATVDKYHSLIRMIQTALVLHDDRGNVLDSNPQAQHLLGLPEDSLRGKTPTDQEWHFVRADGSPLPVAEYPVNRVLADRQPLRGYEAGILHADSHAISWVLINAEPEFDAAQNLACIVVSFVDITGRKRAEESLRENEKHIRRKLDAIMSPKTDLGTLELADIIDYEKIQHLVDGFYRLTHMGIGIVDLHGKVLAEAGWQDICVNFHRLNPETCRLCIESDIELSHDVPPGTFKLYRCKNSMWDIATPIMFGKKQVGNILLGQFLFDDETPDYETFRQQAQRYGFNVREYLSALDRVPRWNREAVNATMSFCTVLAGMIGSLSFSNIKLANALDERRRAEAGQSRLNRELRAISNCTQTLMRAEDEQTLLNSICHIVCEEAGYRMAWVGYLQWDEEKTVCSASS